ncbi:hypothetical protein Tco_0877293 [Tanacetum coccineum]|uniref:Uncharacterized protein n=1 Tax=Tanacetum coccineum TaxID=301880 RepID=A0ABQ5BXN0_9ASTR
MDPNSSLGKIFLGDDVIVISSDKVEGSGDWNSPEYQDTVVSKGKKKAFDGEVNLVFDENMISNEFAVKLCLDYEVKKGKKLVKKELIVALKGELYFVKFIINPEEDDFEPRVILGRSFLRLAQGVVDFRNEKDKVELDGKTVKEDEEAVKRIKGEALKEKDDPSAFIFPIRLEGKVNKKSLADIGSDINTMPYRIFETLGREDMKKIDKGIRMINHTQAEAMGNSNILCQVGVTTIIAKFLILDIPIDHDAPIVVGRGFLHTMVSILNTLERIFSTFDEVCNRDAKSRYNTRLAQLLPRHIYSPCIVNCDVLNRMGCDGEIDDMLRIRVREAESEEEIFTSVAWIRAFNINELIYAELCHEFYSTYEFDEVCADNELQSKKIIKFRLGGRAHSLTLLEFARRLGLYQAVELEEDGFNVYFEGGLHSDDNFNAQDYWLSISHEDNLGFSRSHTSTIRNPILRVIHKMITYGLCQRTTGYDKVQKNDLWLLSMFDARHQNGVLTEDVVRSLSALIYCRDLDITTLRDLIDSNGKLILEDPQPGVPRVGIHKPPRASMQDLYDRMGRMKICQDAIERIEYKQSYH